MYRIKLMLMICSIQNILFAQMNEATKRDTLVENLLYTIVDEKISIAYTDSGESDEVLLFVHGLGSSHKAWGKNIPELQKQYRCIAIDLPGYGASSSGDYDYTMIFFSDVIQKFLLINGIEKVHLVGHSMGGQIALTIALEQPAIVNSLILIAPAGIESFDEKASSWLKQVFSYELLKNLSDAQIIRNFEINFYDMPDDARFMIDDRMQLKATEAYNGYCKMIPKCVAGMLDEPVIDKLNNIYHPVLVLFGENDSLIPNTILHPDLNTIDIANKAKSSFLNVEMLMIEMAGHFLQWEKSEEINANIKKFLRN
jgi:pimeloyl-ACP methyl ester carboxylesterase